MIILAAFAAACITGGLFALAARTLGVDHPGLLIAIGIIGAGAQLLLLIVWYLIDDKRRWRLFEATQQAAPDSAPRTHDPVPPRHESGD